MKKIILFACFTGTLFAQSQSDIAFTAGYNKFDDPLFLRDGHMAYGIRGGVYQDNGLGYQLGFEHISNANCKGLKLNRVYANAVLQSTQVGRLKPYGLLSVGYETSSIKEHKPNQAFLGAGVGVKYDIDKNINAFIETRFLRKLKSDDTDIITTVGLAYALNGNNTPRYAAPRTTYRRTKQVSRPAVVDSGYTHTTQHVVTYVEPEMVPYVERYQEERVVVDTQKQYYIQMTALAKTDPQRYVQKLYKRGIDNVEVKQVTIRGRSMALVVVGPFYDRKEASRNLRRLKRVSRGAFVTKL